MNGGRNMRIISALKSKARKALMAFYYYTKDRKKKSAYFFSFSGNQYSDSPRAISERLHELAPNVQIIWRGGAAVKAAAPDYVKVVPVATREAVKLQAQADVWVFNNVISASTYKGNDVLYIQTFHGDRGFKRCGYDADAHMGVKYKKHDVRYIENKICDYWLTGSEFAEKFAQRSYGYNGEYIKAGLPRNDVLFHAEELADKIDEIKKSLGIACGVKILLYAPTFRDKNREQVAEVDIMKCIESLEKQGDTWVCLKRAHSAARSLVVTGGEEKIIDVTDYPDAADLLLISDCMISDYSSTACDFNLTGKPTVLAQFDRQEYVDNSRSLAVDAKEAGFLVAENQQELDEIMEHLFVLDHRAIKAKVDEFYQTYEGGNATEAVCEVILKHLNKSVE